MTVKRNPNPVKPERSDPRRSARPELWKMPQGTHQKSRREARRDWKQDKRKKQTAAASRKRNRR
ncbi:MAG: hypothetical protein JXB07_18800 [Anaerolineae bacterium]|nr:hypothetical protein [Anaerolineae bacterium]